jgi:putative colanic acid biosynthesis UDP-glucose lipid carrier transferase
MSSSQTIRRRADRNVKRRALGADAASRAELASHGDELPCEASQADCNFRLGLRNAPDTATSKLNEWCHDDRVDCDPSVELRRPPLGVLDRAAKRTFDIVMAIAALVALTPLILLVCIAVCASSPGPAIFRQTRRGLDRSEFRILKFRTMTVLEDGPNVTQTVRGDGRVTRVGRWLRRLSLDELPQLINVLKGEMSLIGPRPHAIVHDDAYGAAIREYALRRLVKPGLTGLAQVEGLRGETPTLAQMQARVARDIWYIENWSMWLDVRIAFQTLFTLFKYEVY